MSDHDTFRHRVSSRRLYPFERNMLLAGALAAIYSAVRATLGI